MPLKSDDPTAFSIQKVVRLMEASAVATAGDLVGVNESEIKQLEQQLHLTFPKVYRQYLITFGRSAGYLSPWMAIYFDDLKEIRETFDLYQAQGFDFELPAKALLIANFENTFDFIVCDGSHDPEVYRVDFRCDQPSAIAYKKHFSGYLESLVTSDNNHAIPQELLDYEALEVMDDLINY